MRKLFTLLIIALMIQVPCDAQVITRKPVEKDPIWSAEKSSYVPTSRTINGQPLTGNITIDGMIYPSSGIPVSTGSTWGTSITNNSANWNAAYSWGNHASAGYVTGTPWTSEGYVTGTPWTEEGYLTAETDPSSLHLDQTTQQTTSGTFAFPQVNIGTTSGEDTGAVFIVSDSSRKLGGAVQPTVAEFLGTTANNVNRLAHFDNNQYDSRTEVTFSNSGTGAWQDNFVSFMVHGTGTAWGNVYLPDIDGKYSDGGWAYLLAQGTSQYGLAIANYNATPMAFGTDNTTRMFIGGSTGNVMMGTTTDYGQRLQIDSGGLAVAFANYTPTGDLVVFGAGPTGMVDYRGYWDMEDGYYAYQAIGGTPTIGYDTSSGLMALGGFSPIIGSNDYWNGIEFFASGTEAMRIPSSGKVLIGTTTDDGANALQVGGGVKADYITSTPQTIMYNNPTFFRPVSADPNWSFGSFSNDDGMGGGSDYWMQSRYFDIGDGYRGFRVEDYNSGSIPFYTNLKLTSVKSNLLVGQSTPTTYYGIQPRLEIDFNPTDNGDGANYSYPLFFNNTDGIGGNFSFTSFSTDIVTALAGDVLVENNRGGMIFSAGVPSGSGSDIRFSPLGWTSTPALDLKAITGNVLVNSTTDDATNKLQVNGSAIATNWVTSGGTSSQFVKGDGSLDSTVYLSAEADTLDSVTDRGAVTTNRVTTGNLTVTDDGSASVTVNAVTDGLGDIDEYVKLLLHFDGSNGQATYTAETGQVVTFVNQAQLSTAQKKFGLSSLLLDGTTDKITLPDSADWALGSGNFTVDFWYNPTSLTSYDTFFEQNSGTNANFIKFDIGSVVGNTIAPRFYCNVGATTIAGYEVSTPYTINTGTFYHFELVRNGTSINIYINGVKQDRTATYAVGSNSLGDFTGVLNIGLDSINADRDINGYIDEFRWSKGIARHTENFTPRTTPYSGAVAEPRLILKSSGNQKAILKTDGADSDTIKLLDKDNVKLLDIKQTTGNTIITGTITTPTLTATRVPFAGTGGLISDDADMTFATDTLTVTKLSAPTSITTAGTIKSTATSDIGWSVVAGANTACNTTCTNACVFGQDTSNFAIVNCASALADVCVCAGAN